MPEKVGERTSSRAGLTPAVDHHLFTAHPDCPLLEENRLHSLTRSKTLQGQSPRYKLGNPTRDRSSRNCGVRLITSICDPAERAYARHDPRMPAPVTDDRGQPLIARDPSGYDASLQWAASPGAIAYHVYWRDAVKRLGTRSDCRQYNSFRVHDASIDDFVFGVAAVGSDGHQSLISAYVASDRLFRYIWAAENFADCPGLSVSFRC